MKKQIFLIPFLMFCLFCTVSAQDFDAVKRKIEQVASGMKTMQCEFVQTKHVKMLDEKMVSKGFMYYRQADKLRWEYVSPYSYIFLLNGSKIVIKNRYRKDEIDIQQNKVFNEIVRIMMSSVVGKCLSDEKRFNIGIETDADAWKVRLEPKSKELGQMFRSISIRFDKKTLLVSDVELSERNGDRTLIELKHVQQNKVLDETLFAIDH